MDAVVEAVRAGAGPTVLVGHSGAGPVVYAAADRVPDLVQRTVYVDSGPLSAGMALRPDLDAGVVELPLPDWESLEADGNSLEGLDDATRESFRQRAVPVPAGVARDAVELHDDRRKRVPVTLVCSTMPSQAVRQMVSQGHPFFAELAGLDVRYVDLPTGHWPMWSRPTELAEILADSASRTVDEPTM